jgi:hypothetical protein
MKTRADDFGLSPLPVLTRDTAPNPARIRRDTLPLDGTWTVTVNGGPAQPVQVPFAPQSKVNGIRVPDGRVELVYTQAFELPLGWTGALLHLEGVDHECEMFVNDVWLARHRGPWDPIGVFVPESVLSRGTPSERGALHSVRVLVRDHSHARTILSGKQERQPREGAIFYGNMSGLWKSVWIEKVADTRLGDFQVVAEASGRLCVTVEVLGAAKGHEVALTLSHEGGGGIALRGEVVEGRVTLIGRVEDVLPWSTDCPNLYFGPLSLLDAQGATVDEVQTYAGFRDFVMDRGYYRLNGRPFYLQGLLNQAIYPDSLYTPTDQHTLTDYEHTLAQGFNGERRHQTTPRHRDLWLADKMGYWLSIELPSGRNLLGKSHRADAIDQWRRIVRAYAWNHPSVFFLVPGNEDWGLLEHAQHRVPATSRDREAFQYELADATEEVAPPAMPYAANDGWRVVTVRKWGQTSNRLNGSRLMLNVHDYASNEVLRRMYGRIARFPKPGTWGKNPKHVFHSADYTYNGQTPLVMSEIGGRALLNRTARGVFAYGKIHRDPEAWAQELGELITLMGELAIVRGGYVLTQTRDAGNDPDDPTSRGEINGILDGRGVAKYAGDRVRDANARARALWEDGARAA